MKLTDITALGRTPIDPSYPTNLAIGALTLLVAIAGAILRLLSGAALLESVQWGIGAGLVVFLTWALGRELEPDHDLSAFVGAGLVLIAQLIFESPSLLVIFWLLLILRIVNRTVGLPAKPLDSLGVLGLSAWLAWQGYWMVGLVAAVGFLLDGLLSPPLRHHLFVSGLAFVATLILSVFHGDIAMESGPTTAVVIASAVMAGLFLVVIATSRESQAVGDATGKPLSPRRVQAGQFLALLTALLLAWWAGASGMVALLPLWAAMTGVGLYRLAILFIRPSK
jgi:uncharacterized membrane protein YjjP (DUF1212 family)